MENDVYGMSDWEKEQYENEKMTWKEKEVYSYLIKFKSINGFFPNITEIAMALTTSRSYAREVLYKLQDKKYIIVGQGYRNITIVKFPDDTSETA